MCGDACVDCNVVVQRNHRCMIICRNESCCDGDNLDLDAKEQNHSAKKLEQQFEEERKLEF